MTAWREIQPIVHPLDATVCVPGSKSLTNRALIVASLAGSKTRITNALFSDDSLYLSEALRALGFTVQLDEENSEIRVTGANGKIPAKNAELLIGNAGTAARFLTAFLTLGHGSYTLDGNARMRQRPIGDLASALGQLGASIETSDGFPPLRITSAGLRGGKAKLAGDTSSQFLSALLMVAPYARQSVEIEVCAELNSKPYADLTLLVMQAFGISVQRDEYRRFCIPLGSYRSMDEFAIEPDASSASYFFAAPALCAGHVCVSGLARSSVQPDIALLGILEQMGCGVRESASSIEVAGSGSLCGVDVDLSDSPDIAQTLAVLAPFASTPTRIRGIATARLKETDRVHATCVELDRLGVQVEEHADGMTIHPCQAIRPANIRAYDDHRMAMAFSLIGLRVPGIGIENPECVSKTFPAFFQVLESLR